MNDPFRIIPFAAQDHEDEVVRLWETVFGYETAHNEPHLVISKKREIDDGLFFVAVNEAIVLGSVMGGYDGHRGWIYSLAVARKSRSRGIGSALMHHAENALRARGCLKINLQIVKNNAPVQAFYESLGYAAEERISMGKRLTT